MRVLMVCSSGGHLTQLLQLDPWSRNHEVLWVTFPLPDAESKLAGARTIWAAHPTTRNIPNLLRNSILAWRVLRSYRPDLVMSSGAGVAVPFFVLARLLRVMTLYLEVFDRIDTATLTGRLCRPFTDLFLVQWEEQLSLYRDATLMGPVW